MIDVVNGHLGQTVGKNGDVVAVEKETKRIVEIRVDILYQSHSANVRPNRRCEE